MSSPDSHDDPGDTGATRIRKTGEHPAPTPGRTTEAMSTPLGEERAVPPSGRYVDPVIGSDVAGYRVKQRLGVGGMGIVYEGEQPVIGKRVAIKVLRPELADNPDVIERLVAEARAVNQVGHRGIIDVFGYGQLPDGRQCIVMEYLDGQSLSELLHENQKSGRTMSEREVLELLEEILSALSAAHGASVVHRDLKPSNIYICRQRDGGRFVKLLDFGIAKLGALGAGSPQARASMMVGTPSYMAPEQAMGAAAAPAMDLYAVGVVAFEMLTNRLPFVADSVVEVLLMHGGTPPPRPSSVMPGVSGGVDDLVTQLMAKEPVHRYPSAEHVRARVLQLKLGLADPTAAPTLRVDPRPTAPSPARPAPSITPEPLFLKRRVSPVAIIGGALALATLALALWAGSRADSPPTPERPVPVIERPPPKPPAPVEMTAANVQPAPAAPPPAPAPLPKPASTAKATAAKPAASKPAPAKGAAALARLERLEQRLARARSSGIDVDLYERQVKKVRQRLAEPISDDERDRLETVVLRLEQSDAF